MLKLPSLGELGHTLSVRVYLCTSTADMRKGFDTLAALVRDGLGHDPLRGNTRLRTQTNSRESAKHHHVNYV